MPEFAGEELDAEMYDQTLSKEYDLLFLDVEEQPVYPIISMRCDTCGKIEENVYAESLEGVKWLVKSGVPISGVALADEYDDNNPDVGFIVCVNCGEGGAYDIEDKSTLTITPESYFNYKAYRVENGEEI